MSVKKKSIEKNITQLVGQQTMMAIQFVGHYNKLGIDSICTGCFCGACYSAVDENCACIKD